MILKSFCLHNPLPPPHTINLDILQNINIVSSVQKNTWPKLQVPLIIFPLSAISRPVFEQQKLPFLSESSAVCLLFFLARINGFTQQTRG